MLRLIVLNLISPKYSQYLGVESLCYLKKKNTKNIILKKVVIPLLERKKNELSNELSKEEINNILKF